MERLNLAQVEPLDPRKMLEKILGLPEQLRHARELAAATSVHFKRDRIKNIVVTGMGGSAICGDVVRAFLGTNIALPFVVNRHYRLPGFVDESSLVIACSYSGNTEETLEAYEEAFRREAQIVCVSSGGALTAQAAEQGHTLFRIPDGYPPRSAIAYLAIPILYTVAFAGIVNNFESDIKETIDVVRALKNELHPDRDDNLAKEISLELKNRIPLIYAGADGFDVIAERWKTQLCENAKIMAFANAFPELNHNEIMGWGPQRDLNKLLRVIYLKDREDHPGIQKRMSITGSLVKRYTAPVREVASRGESRLARLFSLIFLGDMVSLYLAILNKVDPTDIENINFLKAELQK